MTLLNFYQVPGADLFAGEYPFAKEDAVGRRKLAALLDAGIDVFIDLTTPQDPLRPYDPLLRSLTAGASA